MRKAAHSMRTSKGEAVLSIEAIPGGDDEKSATAHALSGVRKLDVSFSVA